MKVKKSSGFTLIELMIVIAIIAIIASIAIPKLMSARLAANESAAISTLRSIASAQAQIQSASSIDTDGDGGGEYAFFGELAGTDPLRVYDSANDTVAAGAAVDILSPSMLSNAFGNITNSVVTRSGYAFQMFLPAATVSGATAGVAEAATGGSSATFPDPDNCEILWACYAWPLDYQKTGNRVFFINQEGDLLSMNNRLTTPYSGATGGPDVDAAFSVADDMGSPLGVNGTAAIDTGIWTAVQ